MRDGRDEAFRERKDSVMGVPGREGQEVKPLAYEGRSIGVFTSGGDSQGIKLTTYFKVALIGTLLHTYLKGCMTELPSSASVT